MSEEETTKEPQTKKAETKNKTSADTKPPKTKSRHRILKWLGLSLLALLMVLVLVAGWFGFVPGLSSLLGANKAKDLGVTYTQADLDSYLDKTDQVLKDFANAPNDPERPGKKVIFADVQDISNVYTQEEITARLNTLDWAYMPLKNIQVRFSTGNQVEVSGNVVADQLDKFISFIGGVGYSDEDVQTGLKWLSRMAGDPAVYVKANASIENGVLQLIVEKASIGRWSAPLNEAQQVLYSGTQNALTGTRGLEARSVTISDGSLNFDGLAPTTIYVKH